MLFAIEKAKILIGAVVRKVIYLDVKCSKNRIVLTDTDFQLEKIHNH